MSEVTRILAAIEHGDVRAVDELFPLVYRELRQLAAQRLSKEKPGQTLQATALVHEAYLRLVGGEEQSWSGRGHFFKRGGDRRRIDLQDADLVVEGPSDDLIALDEALEKLAERDKVKADLVKLRFFTGLTGEQAAEVLGISLNTADRYWTYARSWLHLEILRDSETPRG
jgi:DNA-directed RNA polymerase specialized sigma24 family protein